MQQRQGWMRDFLIEQGQEALAFVGSVSLQDDPNDVAAKIRAALSLANDWARRESSWTDALKTLREAAEGAGILVVINGVVGNSTRRKLDPNEFQGFVCPMSMLR